MVSNGYFRLMGIPLRQGRLFSAEDHSGSPDVAVISETMARRWPSESPLGKRFKEVLPGADSEWLTVIGVVGDVVTNRDGTVYPTFYKTTNQLASWWDWRLVVRTESPPLELAVAVRRAVRSIDSTVPDFEITTVEQALANSTGPGSSKPR